ncbi:MAG: PHP domain-containing protein [Candidatus Nanohaloarchaea archaeon]|nr:PHP domain-containing protein [Candidatus Nanohaloarchaea archaeon]
MDADLHMHTTASDGTDTLSERVEDAKDKNLSCIAITDHDTINPDLEGRKKKIKGVRVVTGAEIKAGLDGNKIEVLGYFLDPEGEEINELFQRIKQYRKDRMKKMVDKINDLIQEEIKLEEVLERAETSVGRPHLARTLKEKGVVESTGEAFSKYISNEGPAFVPSEKVDAKEVIRIVHENGGVTSLAHPGRSLTSENAYDMVEKLVKRGLDGIEVSYTYDLQDRDFSFGVSRADEIAQNLGLIPTGGSDCHGSKSSKYFLGEVRLPYPYVKKLWEKGEQYRS